MGLEVFSAATSEVVSIIPQRAAWLITISASKQIVADKISHLQALPLQARCQRLGSYSFNDVISGYCYCAEKLDNSRRLIENIPGDRIDSSSMDRLEREVGETREEIRTWEGRMDHMLEVLNTSLGRIPDGQ
ncbi:hypothetical protein NEOLI_002063 [Neolecta irregularis DAH-3]|uniref:Uncharacterized protein n=1 Tax=Neolecta irregularis (strain DAH-3) TaxID=1198029 RepID=A0A1U7LQ13_NEOID|nr:hypothetical protein NEOLI_002063 [Neolecta irregularis DAH-3]|eukprot:OLL24611.1 hypothetical protein NEOLI_002063 [Neolecta irregularis DAH-3]